MFTSWDQVKAWIEDNNFARWIFYKNDPEGRDVPEKGNDKIIDSNNFPVSDMADKLAMTEKYLKMYGSTVYGLGFKSPNCTTAGGVVCKARIEATDDRQQSVGNVQPMWDEEQMVARIRKEIQAEYDKKEYERLRADLDRERKAFEEEKNSAMGALTRYLAPVGKAILGQMTMRHVAGVDTEEPVVAQPIVAAKPEEQQEDPFTEEEQDELFELMVRFKKAEPEYLKMIRRVVEMAENGDAMYKTAKGFLVV